MWTIGGLTKDGYKNDIWYSYGESWTLVSTETLFSPRIEHFSINFRGELWVIGGMKDNSFYNDQYHTYVLIDICYSCGESEIGELEYEEVLIVTTNNNISILVIV